MNNLYKDAKLCNTRKNIEMEVLQILQPVLLDEDVKTTISQSSIVSKGK